MKLKPGVLFFCGFAVLAASGSAQAWDALPVFNQGTFARSFALPVLGQSRVLGASQSELRTDYDVITEYYADSNAHENLVMDGETSRFAFGYRRGFGHDLEWNLELPVLIVGGGFMDHYVDEWHSFFGLPDGGRSEAPQNRYLYLYQRDGVTLLDAEHSTTTLGDARASIGWQAAPGLALRGMLQLPTGRRSRLTGGNPGIALWGDQALPFAAGSDFDGFVSAGGNLEQRSSVLSSLQRRWAAFAGAGLGYRLTTALELRSEIYAHTPLFQDTELSGLKKPGVQLTLGGSYQFSPGLGFDVVFQEDAATNSSPDFSLHLGLVYR
ncbi:MAG: DUF3187 family protein [Stenotrophobium sp.]